MSTEVFESHFTVPKSAIDDINHVNNVVYIQWILDVAKQHWEHNTDQKIRNTYVWVVLDHYIKYHHPAFENDHITIKTWIDHHRGVKSERHTQIINQTNQKVLVSSKTTWCLLAKETLRPMRITDEISTLFVS